MGVGQAPIPSRAAVKREGLLYVVQGFCAVELPAPRDWDVRVVTGRVTRDNGERDIAGYLQGHKELDNPVVVDGAYVPANNTIPALPPVYVLKEYPVFAEDPRIVNLL